MKNKLSIYQPDSSGDRQASGTPRKSKVIRDDDFIDNDLSLNTSKLEHHKKLKLSIKVKEYIAKIYNLFVEYIDNRNKEEIPFYETEYHYKYLFGDKSKHKLPQHRSDIGLSIVSECIEFSDYFKTVYLLALYDVLVEHYDILESLAEAGSPSPAVTGQIQISLDEEKTVYHNGYFYLKNKQTGKLLITEYDVQVCTLIYHKDDADEAEFFKKELVKKCEVNDIYKNKCIQLVSYNGMIYPQFIPVPNVQKHEVVLGDEIWDEIDMNAINIFTKYEEYIAEGIPGKRGIILEGKPGNGKTLLLKWLTKELNGKVTIFYTTDQLYHTNGAVREVFELIGKYQPAILIMEDVDGVGVSRDSHNNMGITAELLSCLDGLKEYKNMLLIATTNFPKFLDEAFKNRPNRIDRRLKINPPDESARAEIFRQSLERYPQIMDNIKLYSKAADGFSGAQLKEVIITAKMLSLRDKKPIDHDCLLRSIELIKQNYYDSTIENDMTRTEMLL